MKFVSNHWTINVNGERRASEIKEEEIREGDHLRPAWNDNGNNIFMVRELRPSITVNDSIRASVRGGTGNDS